MAKMDGIGKAADNLLIRYRGEVTTLSEAYRWSAANLLWTIESRRNGTNTFGPFVFDPSEAQILLQA